MDLSSAILQPPPSPRVVSGGAVDPFLRSEVGISVGSLAAGLRQGFAAAAMATGNSVKMAYGVFFWDGVISQLREDLGSQGWTPATPGKLEVVRRKDNLLQLTACWGDEAVGDPARQPSAKHPRGESSKAAVESNQLSLAQWSHQYNAIATWWLLYRIAPNEDRIIAELALPHRFKKNRFVECHTRVMLPDLDLEVPATERHDEPVSPDVVVRRRA